MKSTKEYPAALRPFIFHGVELSVDGEQAQGDCPFCEAKDKFFVYHGPEKKKETTGKLNAPGMFNCRRCNISGNTYTFLTQLHNLHHSITINGDLKKINSFRKDIFSLPTLKQAGLCFNDAGEVLIPCRNGSKNLVNLRKWNPQTRVAYNTPGLCTIYEARNDPESNIIYLVEGEWDAIAMVELLTKCNSPGSVFAVPGANIFRDPWIAKFKGKKVYIIYDNDADKKRPNGDKFNPAKDGMATVASAITKTAEAVKCIEWSTITHVDASADGFDVSDYVKLCPSNKPKLHLSKLRKGCSSPKGITGSKSSLNKHLSDDNSKAIIPVIPRASIEEVMADFREAYMCDQNFEDVLICCFAAVVSLFTSDRRNPLWFFIVGPASSGKTSIIEAFESCDDYTIQVSKLTTAALCSGLRDADENSLLELARNKVIFNKDFTPILTMGGERESVLGILRDAYDGSYIGRYATGVKEFHNLYFGCVAGVTHVIDHANMSEFGERFLKVRIIGEGFDEDAHIQRAMDNIGLRDGQKTQLQGAVHGFVQHLVTKSVEPKWEAEMDAKVRACAKIVARLRTTIRTKKDEMTPRPVTEVASRIATQLKKMGIGIARVLGRDVVDDDCYRIIKKVALDSCTGWFLELVQALRLRYNVGTTVKKLAGDMDVHPNQVRHIVESALLLRIVTGKEADIGKRGVKPSVWKISDEFEKLMDISEMDFKHVIKTPSSHTKRRETDGAESKPGKRIKRRFSRS